MQLKIQIFTPQTCRKKDTTVTVLNMPCQPHLPTFTNVYIKCTRNVRMFICLGWATTQPLHLNLKSLCVFTMCCAILQAMLQNVPANGRYGQSPCTSGSFCISWTWCPSSWELGLMSSNDWTVPDIMHEGSLRIPFRKELRSFLHL